ncbi:MAG: GIY-YIG nuclease family protein [Candidatus Moranbacteria bacterium]|nr:GIY-YIG nuclease family protein [Candidatus Moranbacteria bacterium]
MYYLYMLSCVDGTLYTGITVDLKRRAAEHNSSTLGAKYTRSRRPVTLVFSKTLRSRSLALQAEAQMKKLPRAKKLALIAKPNILRKSGNICH